MAVILVNLSNTHLKNGDQDSAIKDATKALEIIGKDLSISDGVNVEEITSKAYRYRASGYEMSEKWNIAIKDYENLIKISKGQLQHQGIEGLRRCKKALEPKTENKINSNVNNRAQEQIKRSGEKAAQAALERSKAARLKEEAEDEERHALKDIVDSKLLKWKAGKEGNVRALLSSLDMVLWDSLGVKKVGMHELVTDASVKKVYMRVISKVHPDKVSNYV